MLECNNCSKQLVGHQKKFCSQRCKGQDRIKSGKQGNTQKRLAFNRKTYLVNMFGGGCQKCGYNECLRALSFHHRDRNLKKFCVNYKSLQSSNWETILEEVAKCDLLCLNCHAKLHSDEDQTYTFDESLLKPHHFFHKPPREKKAYVRKSRSKRPREKKEKTLSVCPTCQKNFEILSKISKYCSVECRGLATRKVERPDRDTLLNLLKTNSYCAVGRMFNVSDNAVRKWVKYYEQERYE